MWFFTWKTSRLNYLVYTGTKRWYHSKWVGLVREIPFFQKYLARYHALLSNPAHSTGMSDTIYLQQYTQDVSLSKYTSPMNLIFPLTVSNTWAVFPKPWLFAIGGDILPCSLGAIIDHGKDLPSWTNHYNGHVPNLSNSKDYTGCFIGVLISWFMK